jgi:hypothetical protein
MLGSQIATSFTKSNLTDRRIQDVSKIGGNVSACITIGGQHVRTVSTRMTHLRCVGRPFRRESAAMAKKAKKLADTEGVVKDTV